MKNYIKSIALSAFCLASVALTGCEDFLTEDEEELQSVYELIMDELYAEEDEE